MIDSKTKPKIVSATMRGTLVCPHGHNMFIEPQQGNTVVHAVCFEQNCELYRVKYAVSFPVATLTRLEIQDGEGVI